MTRANRIPRRQREKQRHTQEILLAAQAVFAEKGYNRARMSDIAREAEFSVGYLYQMWESKRDLYISLLESKNKDFKSYLKQRIDVSDDPFEKINVLIDAHFSFIEENKDFFRIFLSETSQAEMHVYSTVGKRLMRSHAQHMQLVESVFADGIKRGIFISVGPWDLTIALMGMIFAFAKDCLTGASGDGFGLRVSVMKQIFFRSVLVNDTGSRQDLEEK